MKILSLLFRDDKGGFTKRLYRLYETLATAGHVIHFVGAEPIPVLHERVIQHVSKSWTGTGKRALFWPSMMAAFFSKSFLIARRQNVDRVVTFSPFYTALCILPILFMKVRAVTFIRGDNMLQSSNVLRNAFFFVTDWIGIAISSKVVFVSASLQDVYVKRYGIKKRKLAVIPNNIESAHAVSQAERTEIRRALGIGSGDFVIVSSGPFNKGKNFSFLIQAMQKLKTYRVKLVLIGDEVKSNGERLRLERMAEELDVASSVVFAGWQKDPKPLIASADLYAFPSEHEGSPNALLEALGCSVPCLGSDIKEIEEVLHHDELLFPLDEVQVFTQRVIDILADTTHYNQIRALSSARRKAFTFDWGKSVISVVHSA